MSKFYDVLKARRSIRYYRKAGIPISVLKRVLEAGRWAPSAHNSQPWRFLVLQSPIAKSRLASTMGAALRRDREKDREDPEAVEKEVQASISRFSEAPVLVLVSVMTTEMDVYPDPRRQHAEYTMAVQSVAAAIQNVLLAAHVEGLAACWFCAPLFCQEEVRAALSLSEELLPQAVLAMGFPSENPPPPKRLAFEKVVEFLEDARTR